MNDFERHFANFVRRPDRTPAETCHQRLKQWVWLDRVREDGGPEIIFRLRENERKQFDFESWQMNLRAGAGAIVAT